MNRYWKIMARGTLFIIILFNHTVFSQSQSSEAQKWISLGHSETDPGKKIEAYRKAIELEQTSIDAYLNLGIQLRKKGEYANSEIALRKAYTLGLTGISEKLKSRILYELAKTYRLQEDLEAAEEAFRGAKNLASDKKFEAQISLGLGQVYFLQEKYQQSFTELAKGIAGTEKQVPHSIKLMDAVKQAIEMERIYRTAITASLDGNSRQAKKILLQINDRSPGFKDVEQKLIELEIQSSKKAGIGSFDKNEQTEGMRSINNTRSQKQQTKTNNQILSGEKSSLPQDPMPVVVVPKKPATLAEKVQNTAVLKTKNNSNSNSKQGSQPTRVRVKKSRGADAAFPLTDTFRDTRASKKPPSGRRNPAAESKNMTTDFEEELTTMLTGVQDQNSPAATNGHTGSNGLLSWDNVNPNSEANDNPPPDKKVHSKLFEVSGILMSAIILTLAAYVFFVPSRKANFFKLTGKLNRAAEIYEKLLKKHPHKLWLYPALAKLYDRAGRRDSQAIEVYKMIQHLNFNSDKDNLRAIVAYKYLQNTEKEGVTVEIINSVNYK